MAMLISVDEFERLRASAALANAAIVSPSASRSAAAARGAAGACSQPARPAGAANGRGDAGTRGRGEAVGREAVAASLFLCSSNLAPRTYAPNWNMPRGV